MKHLAALAMALLLVAGCGNRDDGSDGNQDVDQGQGAAALLVEQQGEVLNAASDDGQGLGTAGAEREDLASAAETQVAEVTDAGGDVGALEPDAGAVSADEGVRYEILSDEAVPGIKRTIEVRLEDRVSEEALERIAHALKAGDPRSYPRTFIGYYLPGMQVGAGAWATTHFDPDLEVRIIGLSAAEAAEMSEAEDDHSDLVGRWLDDAWGTERRITIFRDNGVPFVEYLYTDGSSGVYELVESVTESGHRFEEPDAGFGDHVILNDAGDLEFWDSDGYIYTAFEIVD